MSGWMSTALETFRTKLRKNTTRLAATCHPSPCGNHLSSHSDPKKLPRGRGGLRIEGMTRGSAAEHHHRVTRPLLRLSQVTSNRRNRAQRVEGVPLSLSWHHNRLKPVSSHSFLPRTLGERERETADPSCENVVHWGKRVSALSYDAQNLVARAIRNKVFIWRRSPAASDRNWLL
ncbi:hypothetical protein GWK47_040241 [Chionoecetes opilio]|uniref:Uncharacterized protein n=1 Tax=Chionoecetes opilio TaxID=41210 RepID=A0A8J4YJW4_CHIOP|nr:hypothetical protein GWK47_040241 [Chionoecetes opilio]